MSLSAGAALDSAGEAEVDGGEAGWSSVPMFANKLNKYVSKERPTSSAVSGLEAYLKALRWEVFWVGGVPVLDEAPESSPGRPRAPPGPRRRPLLLREENIEVGPRVTFPLNARLAVPLRRRRSSIPTWLLVWL